MHEICLIRIKEEVGEKRSTVGTHGNDDYVLTCPPSITNVLSIKTARNFSFYDVISTIDGHCLSFFPFFIWSLFCQSLELRLPISYTFGIYKLLNPSETTRFCEWDIKDEYCAFTWRINIILDTEKFRKLWGCVVHINKLSPQCPYFVNALLFLFLHHYT